MQVGRLAFNASSNLGQDFPNHYMSLCSETGKRRKPKSSLAETPYD